MNNSNLNLPYTIIRSSKRKTAAIKISDKGIEVRIPEWVDDKWVDQWLVKRRSWIEKHYFEQAENNERFCLNIKQGAAFPLLGKNYALNWCKDSRTSVSLDNKVLKVVISNRSKKQVEECVRQALVRWYKVQAEELLKERMDYWQLVIGLNCNSLKIKGFKRRWGSCSASGEVSLNWRLVMAPQELIDYVIIHELAHLRYMNHGSEFWKLVGVFCPDWKNRRKELNQRIAWVLW